MSEQLAGELGPLRPGARVALLSVSGPPSIRKLAAAKRLVKSWGLVPVVYESARAKHPRADYLSGADAVRAADLQNAWCDPSIDGILVVRGGYGSVRMLDLLDADLMRAARPKPFYGSSDVTAAHEWLHEMLGVPTWFTPMVATGAVLNDPVATEQLREAIFEPYEGRRYTREGSEALVPGSAAGRLTGGNLSLLAMTLGARRRPHHDNRDTIALLEDVHEETYKLDGYLVSLLRAGWFDGVRGIVLGSWAQCDLAETKALVEELLVPLGVPTIWEFGFGHCRGALSLPLGVPATMHADEICSLSLT